MIHKLTRPDKRRSFVEKIDYIISQGVSDYDRRFLECVKRNVLNNKGTETNEIREIQNILFRSSIIEKITLP